MASAELWWEFTCVLVGENSIDVNETVEVEESDDEIWINSFASVHVHG